MSQTTDNEVQFEVVPTPRPTQEVLDEKRDFAYEMMSILNRCAKEQSRLSTSTPEHSNTSTMHVILYGLALSLIREKEQDVAAIAIYNFKDTVEVYYTKNTMKHADIEHANELAELIRSTAKDCLNTTDFFNKYFELILRNCREKFMR